MTKTPEYRVWVSLKRRCCPSKNTTTHYELHGITLCDRWLHFKNFIEDVGPKPTETSKLVRIDPKKGYMPENCKWSEESNVRIDSKWITYKNKPRLLKDLCKEFNLNYHTAYSRLRRGWSIEDTFNTKSRKTNKSLRYYEKDHNFLYSTLDI